MFKQVSAEAMIYFNNLKFFSNLKEEMGLGLTSLVSGVTTGCARSGQSL